MKLLGIPEQKLKRQLRIGGIVLRAAVGEHFAVLGQRGGVDGKETMNSYLRKAETIGPLASSSAIRDRLAAEALAQAARPFVDGFGRVLEQELFALSCPGGLQT